MYTNITMCEKVKFMFGWKIVLKFKLNQSNDQIARTQGDMCEVIGMDIGELNCQLKDFPIVMN